MDINERLTDVFRSVFNDESIELSDDMTASDIDEWDSIAHINLIFAVEEEFGIKFSTGDLNSLGSVGDLRSAVGKRIGGA
jgi:acyl carrier protein